MWAWQQIRYNQSRHPHPHLLPSQTLRLAFVWVSVQSLSLRAQFLAYRLCHSHPRRSAKMPLAIHLPNSRLRFGATTSNIRMNAFVHVSRSTFFFHSKRYVWLAYRFRGSTLQARTTSRRGLLTSRHSRKHRQRQCSTQTHIRARGHFNILVSVKCIEPTKCIQRFNEGKRRRRRRRRQRRRRSTRLRILLSSHSSEK